MQLLIDIYLKAYTKLVPNTVYKKIILSILTAFPRDQSCHFYMMCEM